MPSQTARTSGHGNLIIQIAGHGNTVLDAARPWLSLRSYTGDFWTRPATGEKGSAGFTAQGQQETDLLSPFTRSFALQSRGDLLDRLNRWRQGGGISVQVLTGPGGRGKTRLALNLCDAAREEDWLAGFAAGDEMARFRGQAAVAEWGWTRPLLVVVDYAAAKAGQIGTWLSDLLHHPAMEDAAHPPLRLLLLERQGGRDSAWWRQMLREPMAARLIAPDAPAEVPPIADPALRWAIFAEAFARARGGAAPARDARLDAELGRVSAGGEPLFLGMFGLIAARIGLDAASGLASDEVALRMADQELARIRKAWAARGGGEHGDADLPGLLAALATLEEGWTADQARMAIARECAALGLGQPPTEKLRAALFAALPAEAGGIAPVVPDILGGALAIRAFGSLPDAGIAAILRARAERPDAVTRTVVRACQDFVIRGKREPLAWLQALRAEAADLEGLAALANEMPRMTVELQEVALEAIELVVARARSANGDPRALPVLATALNNLSNRLSDLDRRDPALAAIEEAVGIRRGLAKARPEAFLPDLATSLSNLSHRLSGRDPPKALAAAEEAISIWRRLCAEKPEAYLPGLADSLNNLSMCFSRLDRQDKALVAIEEAVEIHRGLSEARPDVFLWHLSGSLNNLSNRLSDLCRPKPALEAIEEAVAIERQLAEANPDAFLPHFAGSLNNLSVQLASARRRRAALTTAEAAVAIYRHFARARPEAFLADLAMALHNLSGRLSNVGRHDAALAANDEAVAIYRRLAEAKPDATLPDLAKAFGTRGSILRGTDAAAAAASFEEGIAALRGPFLGHPATHAPLIRSLCQDYIEACETAGLAIDMKMLAPIIQALSELNRGTPPSGEET